MTETITVEEYRKLAGKKQKAPAQPAKPKKQPDLVARLCTLLEPYGWIADLYRTLCLDGRNPENTNETIAKNNAVVIWRIGNEPYTSRVLHLGWIWDVQEWTDEQVLMRLHEIESDCSGH